VDGGPNGNDSFADESEDTRRPDMTPDPDPDREFFELDKYSKGTPTHDNDNEIQIDLKLELNGERNLKRTDTIPIGTSPSGSSIMGTPTASPVRLEKRRAEDGEEGPAKRQRTVAYSCWKNDYEGPVEEPHPDLVYRVLSFTEYKRTGANINREYKRKKEFKNPDILEKLVRYYNIIEIGSNYPASKFDPYKWKASSFYDALDAEQQRMMEKIETEKKAAKTKSTTKSSKSKNKSKSSGNSGNSKDKEKERERDKDRAGNRGERGGERGGHRKKEKEEKQTTKTKWDVGAEKDDPTN